MGFFVFLALSFYGDFKKTSSLIISFKWYLFPVALILSSLNFFFRFLRWGFLLKAINIKIDKKKSLLIFLSGLPMALTPLRGGELYKSAMLKETGAHRISTTAPIVFVERLTDAMAMLILMTGGLMIFNYGIVVFSLALVVTATLIIVINHEKTSLALISFISRVPIISRRRQQLLNLYESSKTLLHYNLLLPQIILSLAAWTAVVLDGCLIFYLLGVPLNLIIILSFAFIFCFSGAVGFLTAIPGGLGVSEATVTGLSLLLLHLPREVAATGVLLTRLSTLWFGTGVGIIAMIIFYKNRKL